MFYLKENMNQEIKTRWVEALRCGEYKQGRKALRQEDKFCCLGVLCELAVKDGAIPKPLPQGSRYIYGEPGNSSSNYLPGKVMDWAGIENLNWAGKYNISEENDGYLASDNDNGKTFEEIASIIEEKF